MKILRRTRHGIPFPADILDVHPKLIESVAAKTVLTPAGVYAAWVNGETLVTDSHTYAPLTEEEQEPVDVATQAEEAAQAARVSTEVQAILDAWNKERPQEKPVTLDDLKHEQSEQFREWGREQAQGMAGYGGKMHENAMQMLGGFQFKLPTPEEMDKILKSMLESKESVHKQLRMSVYSNMGMDWNSRNEYRHDDEIDKRTRAEIESIADKYKFGKELRQSGVWKEFVDALLGLRRCMSRKDGSGERYFSLKSQKLFDDVLRLQRLERVEIPRLFDDSPPKKSIDHLREKEAKKFKTKRYRK